MKTKKKLSSCIKKNINLSKKQNAKGRRSLDSC